MMGASVSRLLAAKALLRLEQTGGYSNLLANKIARQAQSPSDSAFAQRLLFGICERRLTLDFCVEKFCSVKLGKLSPVVLTALRIGFYQLLYMPSVPERAAVGESAELVRALGVARSVPLVNACLRGFIRAGKEIPDYSGLGRFERLAVQYSCPAWICELWFEAYGEERARELLELALSVPPACARVNSLKTSPAALAKRLCEEGISASEDLTISGGIVIEGRFDLLKSAAFKEGLFFMQDRASQLLALQTAPKPGERILDAAAAPGGKSFALAFLMEGKGEIVARDINPVRVGLIDEGTKRLGLSGIIKPSVGDAAEFDHSLGRFDKVLCDVPCSGLGAARRKPEIKYKPQKDIEGLPELQYKILQTASEYLCAGKELIYSTCTLNPAENEAVVERFLAGNKGFSRICSDITLPGGRFDCDGFFISRLRKDG